MAVDLSGILVDSGLRFSLPMAKLSGALSKNLTVPDSFFLVLIAHAVKSRPTVLVHRAQVGHFQKALFLKNALNDKRNGEPPGHIPDQAVQSALTGDCLTWEGHGSW